MSRILQTRPKTEKFRPLLTAAHLTHRAPEPLPAAAQGPRVTHVAPSRSSQGSPPFRIPSPPLCAPRRRSGTLPRLLGPGVRGPLSPPRRRPPRPHLRRSRSRTPADRRAAAMFAPTESAPGAGSARDPGSSGGSTTKNPPRQPPSRGAQHQPATPPHRAATPRSRMRALIGWLVGRGRRAVSGGDTPLAGSPPLCPAVPKARLLAC